MRYFFLSASAFSLISSSSAYAGEELKARAEGNFRYGQERAITMTEFWVPFIQGDASVLYGDLRMMGDNQDNREGNLGVGYRRITELGGVKGVAGIHGWLDRRITARGSSFHQATMGTEWLGKTVDLRANGYIPLSDKKEITVSNTDPQGPALVGTGIVVDTDELILEEPQHGLDVELGLELGQNLDFIKDNTDSFRIYGAGYYFNGGSTERITGWRTRLAADISSDVQIGARFQRDNERGSQGFLEATIRFPFGQKKSYRKEGVRARLDESPERDIDIVTNESVLDSGHRVPLINQVTGVAQEILHVDNTAAGGGDGSIETPFNALAGAEAAASAQTVIYVHRGDGTTTNQNAGITLNKTGQQLIGSGSSFVFDNNRFTTANNKSPSSPLLIAATSAPVITNNAGDAVTVSARDVAVAGLTVDGATGRGLYVINNSGDSWDKAITIENIISQNNTLNGFYVEASGVNSALSVSLTNNTSTQNSHGFVVTAINGATIGQSLVKNNTSENNTFEGFLVASDGAGSSSNVTLSQNTSAQNSHGYIVTALNGATIGQSLIKNNTSENNTFEGFLMIANGVGSSSNITLSQNTSAQNSHGFYLYALNGGAIEMVNLTNNLAQNNTFNGFQAQVDGASSDLKASYVSNMALNNGETGFFASITNDGNITQVDYASNLSNGNTAYGFRMNDDSAAGQIEADMGGGAFNSVGKNRIYGNTAQEIYVDLDGAELKAGNNWWGTSTGLAGGELLLLDGSSAQTTPFLTMDPNP